MEPVDDAEAAKQILKDADANDAAFQAIWQQAVSKSQATDEELKKALGTRPAPEF